MTQKERYWTCIVYPESVKENWKEILQETGIQVAISPIHNKDINPDGETKKEHYHLLLVWNGPTTYKRVSEITEEIGATIPKRVMSPIGMIRYLTHKDNPEKAQYDEREIQTINGLDIKDFNGITKSQELQLKRAIVNIINTKKFRELKQIYDYLDKNDMIDMLDIITNKTMFFKEYLRSKRNLLTEKLTNDIL